MALLFCGKLRPPPAARETTVTTSNSAFRIAVLPGDGIGVEVTEACLAVLDVLRRKVGGFALDAETLPAGAAHYRATGIALPDESMAAARAADAVLLGAMGLPSVRYPDGTEIAPQQIGSAHV